MPELAEVETVRNLIEDTLHNKKIIEVVIDDSDRYLFAFAKPKDVRKALVGAKIVGSGRKGKYFWLELNRKPWPIFHLGMSGNISLYVPKLKKSAERIWHGATVWSDSSKMEKERLLFSRLNIVFEGGFEMDFLDPRRFGRMWLADDPWQNPRIKKLGYDPLLNFPTSKILFDKIHKRKKAIKAVLLDQSLFAGIGNWLADEILYQAKLSPHHLGSELSMAQIKNLHKQVLAVVKKAVAVSAHYEKFPKTWLFHDRWGKSKNAVTARKQKIIHEEIGGRTTAWVPTWQK